MKKAKLISAKRSLLMSVLSLILCFAMLLGTTFAWFTDSVTSGVNKIVAGNLDVELYHKDKALASSEAEKVTETVKLFDDVTLWEPGAYCYETFTIKNVGNLAFKYSMVINAVNANKVNDHSLDEVLKVKVVETAPTSRPSYTDGTALKDWSIGYNELPLYPVSNPVETTKPSEKTFTVVVYWEPTDNDNQWNMNNGNQGKTLSVDLGMTLVATQLTYEADSFDDQYDYLSDFDTVTPENFSTMIAGLKGGEKIHLSKGTFSPSARETLKILKDDVTIVGSGKDETIIDCGTMDVSEQAAIYVAGDNVTISNLTVKTSSTLGNVSPIKVSGYMGEDTGKVYKNFKLDNVALEGNAGHGLNLHGVDGAIIDNVEIRSYGKCGISLAKATNVTITNTKIAAGGWNEDIGCQYSASEGNIYNSPCSVTIGAGNDFGNGKVKTDRPTAATGGTDVISLNEAEWIKTTNDDGSFAYTVPVAKIGSAPYMSLAAAAAAAAQGDTIEILRAGTYPYNDLNAINDKAVTVKSTLSSNEAVVLERVTTGTDLARANGNGNLATFENLTVKFADSEVKNGITHNPNGGAMVGNVKFKNCVISGFLYGYDTMTFTDCKFVLGANESKLNMTTYGANVTYTRCTFDGSVNVYWDSITADRKIVFDTCTFNKADKVNDANAAVFVKAAGFETKTKKLEVEFIGEQTLNGYENATYMNNDEIKWNGLRYISADGLWQVDDLENAYATVKVKGEAVFPFANLTSGSFILRDADTAEITDTLIADGYSAVKGDVAGNHNNGTPYHLYTVIAQ